MAKVRTRFVCSECGSVSTRWLGRCPHCGEWNTLAEETEKAAVPAAAASSVRQNDTKLAPLGEIKLETVTRLTTGIGELDTVLGGGIVPGALILLSGDPGIGKSTLVLQTAAAVSNAAGPVLYASGEESAGQIKLRAERLGIDPQGLFVQADTYLDSVLKAAETEKAELLIVDSIQTMYTGDCDSAPGSQGQVREGTNKLMNFAKSTGIPVIVVGHVTKEGTIAGPRLMEHLVDVVLYLEGERHYQFRVLRSMKNRFGSTHETGLFTMSERGLEELVNPSALLLAERSAGQAGSAVAAVMDGMRPLVGEVQALTSRSVFSVPRRTVVGMDYNRLILLLAVLEKRAGLNLSAQDVYINVAGGLKVNETAADLPVALSVVSSFRDMAMDKNTVVMGEIGLTGDIRRVPHVRRRIQEAAKLGFTRFIIPVGNADDRDKKKYDIVAVKTLREAVEAAFNGT